MSKKMSAKKPVETKTDKVECKAGLKVRANCGGPVMVVYKTGTFSVMCKWWDEINRAFRNEEFTPEMLTSVE